jgi:hypothetical protein
MKKFITPEDASKLTSLAIRRPKDRGSETTVAEYESPFALAIHKALIEGASKNAAAGTAAGELEGILNRMRAPRARKPAARPAKVKKKR